MRFGLSVAFILAGIWLVCWTLIDWLEAMANRFVVAQQQGWKLDLIAPIAAFLIIASGYAAHLRRKWRATPGAESAPARGNLFAAAFASVFTIFGFLLDYVLVPCALGTMIWILLNPLVHAGAFWLAKTPAAVTVTVLEANQYWSIHPRSDRKGDYLLVRWPDSTQVLIESRTPTNFWEIPHTMKVDGICTLNRVRPGSVLRLDGRRSSLGFSIDKLSSINAQSACLTSGETP